MLNKPKRTRELINCASLTDYSLVTQRGDELVYFLIHPTNISVLSQETMRRRVYSLMNVLRSCPEIELLALNSRESFENNKRFLQTRIDQEDNVKIRELLEQDKEHLNRVQVQTATAREFVIVVRMRGMQKKELFPYLNRVERLIRDQQFEVRRADHEDIQRILAVYFAQNVISEHFDDFDGERWFYAQKQRQH